MCSFVPLEYFLLKFCTDASWAELEQEQNEYIQPQSLWEAILLFHCVCASRKKLLFLSISYVPLTSDSCLFLPRIMECGNVEIRLIRAFQNWTQALWEWPRWQSCSLFCVCLHFVRSLLQEFEFNMISTFLSKVSSKYMKSKWHLYPSQVKL